MSLQKLIALLSENNKENYNSIFKNFNIDAVSLLDFESWSSKKYTRNCLHRESDFELILLCWEAGQETPIHCHGGEECWVNVLQGEVEEVFYSKGENDELVKNGTRKLCANESSYINDLIGLHKLKNSYKGRTISLHLYAKPIDACTFFDEQTQSFVAKQLSYDTYKELLLSNSLT
ncbi:cysteine dioxygenase [Ichthyenterobacterium magnum]|uniref:Cysteine dioxygenase n=1 Tax=Ichthyenterobacterium magnum TaxID=1230530 RepID=A0A420DVT1_9FLAO|nr:cysteine dioxygenase family protein [Ichthyenterobacterium magnum]RKE98327.1 cysteine dioxygenase [Ichthyenterobacterium magnum]